MGTLEGFPNPPAMVRAELSSAAPHAFMGTLEGFALHSAPTTHPASPALRAASPNPPAMVRTELSSAAPHAFMGTLEGFPNPPAMVRADLSSAAPHAFMRAPVLTSLHRLMCAGGGQVSG